MKASFAYLLALVLFLVGGSENTPGVQALSAKRTKSEKGSTNKRSKSSKSQAPTSQIITNPPTQDQFASATVLFQQTLYSVSPTRNDDDTFSASDYEAFAFYTSRYVSNAFEKFFMSNSMVSLREARTRKTSMDASDPMEVLLEYETTMIFRQSTALVPSQTELDGVLASFFLRLEESAYREFITRKMKKDSILTARTALEVASLTGPTGSPTSAPTTPTTNTLEFRVFYTYEQTRLPFPAEVDEVTALTSTFIETRLQDNFGAGITVDLTVANFDFILGEPYQIGYSANIESSANLSATDLLSAIETIILENAHLEAIMELDSSKIFSTTSVITFLAGP